MKSTRIAGALMLAGGAALLTLTGCAGEDTVSFSNEVKPILAANCFSCHQDGGAGYEASGFKMDTYKDLMQGTQYGPMILPGDAEGSNLVVLMEGRADPSIAMPHGKVERVPKRDIDTIRRWIDQGARDN